MAGRAAGTTGTTRIPAPSSRLHSPPARGACANRRPQCGHVLADPVASGRLSTSAFGALRAAAGATKRGDFVHKAAGLRNGSLNYTVKHGLNRMQFSGPLAGSERNEIRVRDIATSKWTVGVRGDRNKRMNLVFESKLGTGRDRVTMIVDELPMFEGPGLEMNLRPGLAGMDILTQGGRVEIPMTVQMRLGEQNVERRCMLPFEGGIRVQLPNLLSEGTVSTSRIEGLFGPEQSAEDTAPAVNWSARDGGWLASNWCSCYAWL
jgi:hypothetical protein